MAAPHGIGACSCPRRAKSWRRSSWGSTDPFGCLNHESSDALGSWIRRMRNRAACRRAGIGSSPPTGERIAEAEIKMLARDQRSILQALSRATPEQRASIHREVLGLRHTFTPEERSIGVDITSDQAFEGQVEQIQTGGSRPGTWDIRGRRSLGAVPETQHPQTASSFFDAPLGSPLLHTPRTPSDQSR